MAFTASRKMTSSVSGSRQQQRALVRTAVAAPSRPTSTPSQVAPKRQEAKHMSPQTPFDSFTFEPVRESQVSALPKLWLKIFRQIRPSSAPGDHQPCIPG